MDVTFVYLFCTCVADGNITVSTVAAVVTEGSKVVEEVWVLKNKEKGLVSLNFETKI